MSMDSLHTDLSLYTPPTSHPHLPAPSDNRLICNGLVGHPSMLTYKSMLTHRPVLTHKSVLTFQLGRLVQQRLQSGHFLLRLNQFSHVVLHPEIVNQTPCGIAQGLDRQTVKE